MVKNKMVDRLYFQQHATLRAHLVSEAIFEGQWYCYSKKYTDELLRRNNLDDEARGAEKLEVMSDITMATYSNTLTSGSKTKSSQKLQADIDMRLAMDTIKALEMSMKTRLKRAKSRLKKVPGRMRNLQTHIGNKWMRIRN